MNILLWVLQGALALHTLMGAFWKFSNTSQAVVSLKAIPHGVWISLSIVEILCAIALVLPGIAIKSLAILVPVAALVIAAEMLVYCGIHFYSGEGTYGQPVYWLVVAAICGFIAYGRLVLNPL